MARIADHLRSDARLADRLLAALFFVVGFYVGREAFFKTSLSHFYQMNMPALGAWICPDVGLGRDLSALTDFLWLRRFAFDCATLPPHYDPPLTSFEWSHLYLFLTTAAAFRTLGPKYTSLWPVYGVVFGGYFLFAFLLLRHFFDRTLATFGAGMIIASSAATGLALYLRDLSKGPFILCSILLLLRAVRANTPSGVIKTSVIAGATIGLGMGFRADLFVLLPVAFVVLLLFAETPLKWRVAAAAALTAGFFILSAPIWLHGRTGGYVAAIEGQSAPFARYLGLPDTRYDIGHQYNDELTTSTMAADLRRIDPGAYDQAEWTAGRNLSQTYQRSLGALVDLVRWLPADFLARSVASAWRILSFYRSLDPSIVALDPAKVGASSWAGHVLGSRWVAWIGPAFIPLFFFLVWTRSKREAMAIALVLGVLLTYPILQFSFRHIFHLEFVFWLGPLAFAALLWRRKIEWRAFVTPALLLSAVLLLAAGALQVARARQEEALAQAIETDLSRLERVLTAKVDTADGEVLFRVDPPDAARAVLASPPDTLDAVTITPAVVISSIERMVVELAPGETCKPQEMALRFAYAKTPQTWQPLDRMREVSLGETDNGVVRVIFPAFYRATQHFDGVVVSGESAGCVKAIYRVKDPTSLTLGFFAVLGKNWKRALFQPLF